MFNKTLPDLVKGLRAHKKDERQFISQCLKEIKEELKETDNDIKCEALRKLSYLHMFGFDISWAAFQSIEAMSVHQFSQKRIGYLVATQAIKRNAEVALLTTNLFKKDLASVDSPFESGIAMNCLSNICTPELARDLASDVVALMNNSRPYVRKRASLLTYKIFVNYPEALRPTFPRLKEKLQDPDTSVVSASVNVICELARKNPKNYLSLAPLFFKILTSSGNNWMLIKIVKLLGALCPLEPRLAKKLSEPITNIISTTPAKSLLYECISTATSGMTQNKALMELCTEKLRGFVMEPDPNLKYLGLVGLCNVIVVYPRMIAGHKDIILACLDDEDVTIRMRVLELLAGMASRKNLPDIVRKIRQHIDLSDGAYRDKLVGQLIGTCAQDNYSFVADFEWYISTLVDLSHLRGLTHGKLISDQLIDVVVRVDSIRQFAVNKMLLLLRDPHILSESTTDTSTQEVLFAAAWVLGEFASLIDNYSEALNALTQSRVTFLPSHVQGAYVLAAFKVLVAAIASKEDEADEVTVLKTLFDEKIKLFTESIHIEVQERACFAKAMVENMCPAGAEINTGLVQSMATVLGAELNPVGAKAQRKVRVPAGLDLETWINEELLPEAEVEEEGNVFFLDGESMTSEVEMAPKLSKRELRRMEKEQKRLKKLRKKDPFYLAGRLDSKPDEPTMEEIPINQLDLSHMDAPEKGSKKKKKKGKKGANDEPESPPAPAVFVRSIVDEPEGDDLMPDKSRNALDIDISAPLRTDEVLPEMRAYGMQTAQDHIEMPSGRSSKKKKKKGKEDKEEKESKKKKKKKGKEEEAPAPLPEVVEKKSKKGKKDKKSKSSTSANDLLDLMGSTPAPAPAPVVEPPKPDKKAKKEKKSKKDKSSSQAQESSALPTGRMTMLCQNESLSVAVAFKSDSAHAKQVGIPFIFKNTGGSPISDVAVRTIDSMNTKLVSLSGSATDPFTIQPGATVVRKLHFSCESFVRPQKTQGTVTFNGSAGASSTAFQLVIPCTTYVIPTTATKETFAAAVSSPTCKFLSSTKLAMPPDKMAWGIESLAEILHVELIECVSGAASFYGVTSAGQPVAVLVKAKSSGLALEVRSFDENFVQSLTAEAAAVIAAEL